MQSLIIIMMGLVVIVFIIKITKPQKITNYPSKGKTVVAFGDSLITGYGSTSGNNFVSLLEDEIGRTIINLGVPGETSEQGLARVSSVIDQNPKVVLILLGGNDYIKGIPIETTFKNMDAIVRDIQKSGAVVVLLGIQGGILTDPYEVHFKELAKKRGTLYVPNVLNGVIGNSELMSDEVHPNDKGYRVIANKIYPVLRKAF